MTRYGEIDEVTRNGYPRSRPASMGIAWFLTNSNSVDPDAFGSLGVGWSKVAPLMWGCHGWTMRYGAWDRSGGFQGFTLRGPGTWVIPLVYRELDTYTSATDVERESMQALRAADWYVRTGLIPGWAVP